MYYAPQILEVLTSGTCDWYEKRVFEEMIQLMLLQQRDYYPGLSGGP